MFARRKLYPSLLCPYWHSLNNCNKLLAKRGPPTRQSRTQNEDRLHGSLNCPPGMTEKRTAQHAAKRRDNAKVETNRHDLRRSSPSLLVGVERAKRGRTGCRDSQGVVSATARPEGRGDLSQANKELLQLLPRLLSPPIRALSAKTTIH